ncbi:hypothetical protein G7Y89_g8669 [Cudoniella acicularis]|uniref:Transcription initiation factor IIA large subunit n=1 Tax=Cudoniella acicularis TaxID=354080 RepID=A0A8H4W2N3_9HELO|nr:hypothetical protein G7Y89_g8669 [Cudoniella acicularis]
MSNTQVGNVYQQIIADVIESSRVDFEEGGVEENVLDELRQGWQQKLSSLQVATFPWDPKPEPAPAISNPPTVPSNAGNYHSMNTPPTTQPQSGMTMPQVPTHNNSNGASRIKTEPGLDSPPVGMTQAPYQNPILSMPNATPAQQRAAQHLQNNYGPRAAASINAIQGVAQQPQNPQMPSMQQQQHMQQQQAMHEHQMQQMQQQRAGQMPVPRPQMTQEQYRQAMAMQAAQAQQRVQSQNGPNGQNGMNGVNNAQTDGAGDEMEDSLSLIKQVNANGDEVTIGRVEIDGMIRKKIEAMGHRMEGGGLMLPLHQASTPAKRQRKVKKTATGLVPQTDGPGSDDDDKDGVKDEEFDEDAINSDLDDPDDGLNDEEDDDEGMGHIMLCMYDKVQRVKNKWKCVMKDGVLTVNGKEYVFHKATGEYEW